MKKTALIFAAIFAVFTSGCSKKQEPTVAKVETNTTVEKPEAKKDVKPAAKEVTKTIKRTNVTINNYSECPSSQNNDYKTIPYE